MDKWFYCPYCKAKVLKINDKAKANGLFWKCKKCKKEIEIKI